MTSQTLPHRDADEIIAEANAQQRIASDPARSAWVGASAGSGKTKVLIDRILRLLLPREDGQPGTRPEKILALTFTKAAASEMALRLQRKLSDWVALDQDALSAELAALLGRPSDAADCDQARRLFARIVDMPGGLNIMTIHSFCQSILGRFPIEAGLPPNFQLLGESRIAGLLLDARKDILRYAAANPAHPLANAVSYIATDVSDEQLTKLLNALVSERHQVADILTRSFGTDGLYARLCQFFSLTPGLNEQDLRQNFCGVTTEDHQALRDACVTYNGSDRTDAASCAVISAYLAADSDKRLVLYSSYRDVFLKKDGESRKKIFNKAFMTAHSHLTTVLDDEMDRILSLEKTLADLHCTRLTHSVFVLGRAILEKFAALKLAQAALDYDDLILKTLSLLKGDWQKGVRPGAVPWVHYKLDEGLDHILVDEAQDTNPEQWEIIKLLADDFFSGDGARQAGRTLFVVGDEKQSIFRFQRAAPEKFTEMREFFRQRIEASQQKFTALSINTSFRSVQTVLDGVDAVFAARTPPIQSPYLSHIAKRQNQPGLIEVWPLFQSTGEDDSGDETSAGEDAAKPPDAGWFVPRAPVAHQTGSTKMATTIAGTIRHWLDSGEILKTYDRPIHPGDILILVRARGAFVGQLVRALKQSKIPVSGVDRMVLGDQLVVKDLCAAAEFALNPLDDLALACLLKTPFAGLDDDALYALAAGRDDNSLWTMVKRQAKPTLVNWLEDLIALGASTSPYEFFSAVAQRRCPSGHKTGTRAILTRLGDEAIDPLDEFLNAAASYDRDNVASLQGFLAWQRDSDAVIKRELEEAGRTVRIMTVHGAKGLQAPIVFLPDTVRTRRAGQQDIHWPQTSYHPVPLVASAAFKTDAVKNANLARQAKDDEEYQRLLYVAMTRAEERLYVGGFYNKTAPGTTVPSWHIHIYQSLLNIDIFKQFFVFPNGEASIEPVLRLDVQSGAMADKDAGKNRHVVTASPLPDWSDNDAPSDIHPPRPLVPSRASPDQDDLAVLSPVAHNLGRFQRGLILHKLLQLLPNLSPKSQQMAGERYLNSPALKLTADERKAMLEEALRVVHHPEFGEVFGPGSQAEVPLSGLLDHDRIVSAQIDRIIVKPGEILLVDFKTNRPPPIDPADIPPAYRRQMEIYAALVRKIYPDRKVRAALLWTDTARLMPIDV